MKRSSYSPASLIVACAATLTLALSATSRADAPDLSDGSNPAEHWSLGLGLVVQQHPYVGVGTRILPFPFVSYRNDNFFIEGLSAGYIVWHGRGMSLAITLSPRLGGYKASDSPALSGMANRNFTLDGGVAATLHRRWGMLRLSGRSDLLGVYNGQILDLSYGMPLPVGRWHVMPSIGVRWQSSNLVDYYYGVTATEARPGRPAYRPGAATDPYFKLSVFSPAVDHWRLFASAGVEALDASITRSPIVAKHYSMMSVVGFLTRF